ncbi:hypothetical protein [Agromyces larvae]|uniref:Uncharacterized protein n=1 Tax=Agromyces larvae TaxID=2929802 RepID=A0ABY4C533_9MICO|nr:hypothetical protein [Agromyces larvae]UOE43855.1 hypothetical protein MTO99_17065 [Agromyces larvae]
MFDFDEAFDKAAVSATERTATTPRRYILLLVAIGLSAVVMASTVLIVGVGSTVAMTTPPVSYVRHSAPVKPNSGSSPTLPASPATTPDPVYGAQTDPATIPLPEGLTDAQAANARIWLQQSVIIAQCMAEQGFEYFFTPYWQRQATSNLVSPVPVGSPAWFALTGETGAGDAYRWEDAGCQGYAVHVTGMDDAN